MRVRAVWVILLVPLLAGCAQPAQVPVGEPGPDLDVDFSWSPSQPRAGQPVTFTPAVSSSEVGDAVIRTGWHFGDGAATAEGVPAHVYAASGSYEVKFQVETRLAGVGQSIQTVHVLPSKAVPSYSSSPAPTEFEDAPQAPALPPVIEVDVIENVVTLGFDWSLQATIVYWEFDDGWTSNFATVERVFYETGERTVRLRVLAKEGIAESVARFTIATVPFEPHVIVAVPDTGINPYHEIYRRPELTGHPCTYIRDFPCNIPALNLSLDEPDWQTAFNKDRAKWQAIRPGDVFWIPQTVFVAVLCQNIHLEDDASQNLCILDDSHMHGTGTTSSVLMENPGALIAFKESTGDIGPFQAAGIPVDVYSVSWGYTAPIPALPGYSLADLDALYVKSSGNDPAPSVIDGWSGHPDVLSVGGAYAQGMSEEALSRKQAEIVSYYCRPTAQTRSLDAMRPSYCGTSFAAPTAAGAISKVILAIREDSGYTGSLIGNMVDPIAGISIGELRQAINLTASYSPKAEYPNDSVTGVPLNPVAPWVQWGWGFYDGRVAQATIDHLLDGAAASKPDEAVLYMETQMALKEATHPL